MNGNNIIYYTDCSVILLLIQVHARGHLLIEAGSHSDSKDKADGPGLLSSFTAACFGTGIRSVRLR